MVVEGMTGGVAFHVPPATTLRTGLAMPDTVVRWCAGARVVIVNNVHADHVRRQLVTIWHPIVR